MKKVKVVEGFFDGKVVGKIQRQHVKMLKNNKVGGDVVVEDAYSFYMRNSWFKKQLQFKTRPVPGQKLVVIYYKSPEVVVEKESVVKKVVKVVKNKLRSLFATLMPKKVRSKEGKAFSPVVLFKLESQMQSRNILEASAHEIPSSAVYSLAA